MRQLSDLSNLLKGSVSVADRAIPQFDALDSVIAALQKHNQDGTRAGVPEDLQLSAVRMFWETQRFETLRDARLVSFGLCLPNRPAGRCIMEDRQRFRAVLDAKTGVDQWAGEPRWYRRCYQGLVRSYFTYDALIDQAPVVAKQNWGELRDYLNYRAKNIVDEKVNPDWVHAAIGNRKLFSEDPCTPYAADVLSGQTSELDRLCEQLGVAKSSWFLRELVLAQVRQATTLDLQDFKQKIPSLLEILASNPVLRDRGLILMLDRYCSGHQVVINEPLRNASVEWWGNPWLPSNEMRWGGVVPAARKMVSEWLKYEFIEAFFTKLAEDGVGDRRRANFWLRYAKSMDNIQFALGKRALYSRDRDFEALRKKMTGLYTELKGSGSANNAFIMTLGDLVAVEFGDGGAFYGYDVRRKLPFDVSLPVGTSVDAANSLKHSNKLLWMKHQDGIHGWNCWEDGFEATLKKHFNIHPNATRPSVAQRPLEPIATEGVDAASSQIADNVDAGSARHVLPQHKPGRVELYVYAKQHGLTVEDLRKDNGNLWVRANDSDLSVVRKLSDWGFQYKAGKGWWL